MYAAADTVRLEYPKKRQIRLFGCERLKKAKNYSEMMSFF
jgi:hypothetical protein